MKSSRATDATQACRRSHHGSAHFVARIPGRPCLVELREPATADSTSNTPTRTGCRGAPLPPPMELSVRMHVLTMVGNSVVISASATKVSGIEERRVSVLRAVWLSKFGPPCSSFGAPRRGAFVVFCVCCPVSPIFQYLKKALQTKRGWSGERGGAGGDFVFLPLFLPPGLVAC